MNALLGRFAERYRAADAKTINPWSPPGSIFGPSYSRRSSLPQSGHIDRPEPEWRRRTADDGRPGISQRDPIEGGEPTESTTVYVVYDSDNLHIGAILYDSNPDGILAYQRERDASLFADDRFTWILDTFLDGRTGCFFGTNPNGLMSDGLIGPRVSVLSGGRNPDSVSTVGWGIT